MISVVQGFRGLWGPFSFPHRPLADGNFGCEKYEPGQDLGLVEILPELTFTSVQEASLCLMN
jgi:hypothetical protein